MVSSWWASSQPAASYRIGPFRSERPPFGALFFSRSWGSRHGVLLEHFSLDNGQDAYSMIIDHFYLDEIVIESLPSPHRIASTRRLARPAWTHHPASGSPNGLPRTRHLDCLASRRTGRAGGNSRIPPVRSHLWSEFVRPSLTFTRLHVVRLTWAEPLQQNPRRLVFPPFGSRCHFPFGPVLGPPAPPRGHRVDRFDPPPRHSSRPVNYLP